MKKKLLALALAALILLHLPIIYGLFQSYRARHYLEGLNPQAQAVPFQDVRGAFHVHSLQGGHSIGTYEEIVEAAIAVGCRFVFLTEHADGEGSPDLPEQRKVVLIRGTEREGQRMQILQDRRGRFRVSGDLKPGGDVAGLEGLEIFNLHESARRADTWYLRILAVYHQLILRPFFPFHLWHVDRGRIVFWDNVLAERPVTGVGGADAHQNIGLIVRTASGRKILRLQLDPYEESFRFVTTHVLLNRGTPVNEGSILEALRMGAAYVAFESIAPTEGFSFHAVEAGRELRMGSKVTQRASLVLKSPLEVRVRLFHNGSLQRELEGDRFEFTDLQPGYYRVELLPLHAPGLLFSKPWILSNPIYVTER